MFGIININKPPHLTSRDVVNRVCRAVGLQKVGHAGTLDPMAVGVLIVCVGPATRLVTYIHQFPKTYVADFQLGVESSTEDKYGQLNEIADAPELNLPTLQAVLPGFVGHIQQVPPAFSALKLGGKPAYHLARQGAKVELDARHVTIYELEVLEFDYPDFKLRIQCGSGTYVRSLGRDIARRLGTAAIMTKLIRTAVGDFAIDDAVSIEVFENEPCSHLQSPLNCLPKFPQCVVDATQIEQIANGRLFNQMDLARQTPNADSATTLVAIDSAGKLIAVFERFDQNNFKPKINFANYWRQAE